MPRRRRRTVRIRCYPKRRVYTMSIEDFLAHFEPVDVAGFNPDDATR